MAEVLGFLGFAVTVVNTTLQVIEAVQTIRHAPKEIQDLALELKLSRATLEKAQTLAIDVKDAEPERQALLSDYIDKMKEVAKQYQDIEERIKKYAHKAHRLGWLWYKSAIRSETDKLKRYHQSFKDMIQLLSADDVREIKNSLMKDPLLEKLNSAISNIEAEMQDDNKQRTFVYLMDKLSRNVKNRREFRAKYQSSPPDWVLHTDEFRSWANAAGSQKWLWGIGEAGTGKTITATYLADQLQDSEPSKLLAEAIMGITIENDSIRTNNSASSNELLPTAEADSAMAIIYFSYKSKADADPEIVIRSLIRQFLEQLHEDNKACAYERMLMVQELMNDYASTKDKVDSRTLLETLLADFARPYIILDALDEYVGDWQALLGYLNSLDSAVKIIVTSRGGHDNYMKTEALRRHELVFSVGENDGIIQKFVTAQLQEIGKENREKSHYELFYIDAAADPKQREDMARIITKKADHNFLCSSLHVNSLRNAKSKEQLDAILERLPEGLNDMLKDVILRVKDQSPRQAEIGRLALQWAIYSRQNLELKEIWHAIVATLYPNRTGLKDKLDEFSPEEVIDCTNSFLATDSNHVVYIHKSIRDFCSNEAVEHEHFPNCHAEMALVCLRYLDPRNFRDHCDTEDAWKKRAEEFPLVKYAAANWGYHLAKSGEHLETKDERYLYKLLGNDKFLEMSTAAMHSELKHIEVWHDKVGWDVLKWNPGKRSPFQAIHLLAYFNLAETMDQWILEQRKKPDFDIDTRTTLVSTNQQGHTALWIACRLNSTIVVRVLLENGADNALSGGDGTFPLGVAAYRGYTNVVYQLLDMDDSEKIAKLLKQTNRANVRPLWDAVVSGSEDTVAAILDKIAEFPDAKEIIMHVASDLSALQEAARLNLPGIALQIGQVGGIEAINQNSNKWRDTALHVAAHGRHETLRVLLNELKADPNSRQKEGKTPLGLAVQDPYADTGSLATTLMNHPGTDLEAVDDEGRTILHLAAEFGRPLHVDAVKYKAPRSLITKKDKNGRTPMAGALQHRRNMWREAISSLLVFVKPEEIDIEEARKLYREGLKLQNSHWLEQLLEKVPNAAEVLPDDSNMVLHDLVKTGSLDLMKNVYQKVKNISANALDIRDSQGQTPLLLAAALSQNDLARFLIESGAGKNTQRGDGKSALHLAVDNNNEGLVNILLLEHIDYNLLDNVKMKALQRISSDSAIRQNKQARLAQYGLDATIIHEREILHSKKTELQYVAGDEETRKMIMDQSAQMKKESIGVGSMHYLVSEPLPQIAKIPISRVHVKILGCDQGQSDHLNHHPQDRGKNFNGSNTWYDLAILRGQQVLHQYEFSRNIVGAEPRWYESSWHIDKGHDNNGTHPGGTSKWTRQQDHDEARRFVRELRQGDRVVVIPRTRWRAWICQIFEAEIRVYYRDWEKRKDD